MAETTTCARHPSVETGLRCVACETPICPRCAQDAPIGMRCPVCAAPDRSGGLRRRPEQVRAAAATAAVGALLGGVLLGLVAGLVGFFTLFAAYLIGMQIGQRVLAAASGNTVDVVRLLALAGGAGAGVVGELVRIYGLGQSPNIGLWVLGRIAIAGYGAWSRTA